MDLGDSEVCNTVQVAVPLGPSVPRLDELSSDREIDQQVSPECGGSLHSDAVPITLVALETSAVVHVDPYTAGQRDQPSTILVESNMALPLPRSLAYQLDDASGSSEAVQRRTSRSTAGQHSNPYHLPQAVERVPVPTLWVSIECCLGFV